MDSISKHIVQLGESQDNTLREKLPSVNIRLLRGSSEYRAIIEATVDSMARMGRIPFGDYPEIRGISGANIGIPLNIVGIRKPHHWEFLINPTIVNKSEGTHTVKSNCGSLRLKEPIEVERYDWVDVTYYTISGSPRRDRFSGSYGNTVQHEIDHNNGILIIHR